LNLKHFKDETCCPVYPPITYQYFFSDLQLNVKKLRNQPNSSKLRILLANYELLFCLTSPKARKEVYYIESQVILQWCIIMKL